MNIEEHLKFWEDAKPHQMNATAAIRWFGTPTPWHYRICNMIAKRRLTNIFDAGCGVGLIRTLLKSEYSDHKFNYKGIDITPKFVNICQKLEMDVSIGNIENIDESDNTYDLAMALDVLNHQMDFKKSLSELIRISNKIVYISFFREFKDPSEIVYKHTDPVLIYHHYNKQDIIDYLNTFDNIEMFEFFNAGRQTHHRVAHSTVTLKNTPNPHKWGFIWENHPEQRPTLLPHEDLLIIKA